jgi:hypothetical protein
MKCQTLADDAIIQFIIIIFGWVFNLSYLYKKQAQSKVFKSVLDFDYFLKYFLYCNIFEIY